MLRVGNFFIGDILAGHNEIGGRRLESIGI